MFFKIVANFWYNNPTSIPLLISSGNNFRIIPRTASFILLNIQRSSIEGNAFPGMTQSSPNIRQASFNSSIHPACLVWLLSSISTLHNIFLWAVTVRNSPSSSCVVCDVLCRPWIVFCVIVWFVPVVHVLKWLSKFMRCSGSGFGFGTVGNGIAIKVERSWLTKNT